MNPEKREQLPGIAFKSFAQRFVPPTLSEGFQDIHRINFKVRLAPSKWQANLTCSSFEVRLNNEKSGVCIGYQSPRPKDAMPKSLHLQVREQRLS
jgi:hypothetical protein